MSCMNNELSLLNLCVTCANLDQSCLKKAKAEQLDANQITTNKLCVSDTLSGNNILGLSIGANELCARSGTINELCVDKLTVANWNSFNKYRAAVTLINDPYTLGAPVNWNNIIDDPNNNVTTSPFSYTAPVSGYYTLSYYINSVNLNGADAIGGIPIGLLTIYVNGKELRQFNAPYLAFSTQQYALLSSIALLNAGDVITMDYNVLVQNSVMGLQKYVGTVNLNGTTAFADSSGFEIHLLSQMTGGVTPPPQCKVCPIVEIPCQPNDIDCKRFECSI